jgi:predicted hotdog family 3-hydroxylacyl-ACP dehydratase
MAAIVEHIPAEGLLPHTRAMRLIDELIMLDREKRTGIARVRISPGRVYLDEEGFFQNHWLVELMAQAAAALSRALRAPLAGRGTVGFLLSLRGCELPGARKIQVGDALHFAVHFDVELYPVGHCEVVGDLDGEVISRACMTLLDDTKGGLPSNALL